MERLEGYLLESVPKAYDNRLLAVAGGVVFFSLLALFPAVAAFVSLYGVFADASTIDQHLSMASGILPGGGVDILHEELVRLAAKSDSKLSFGFLFGLAFALWSANAGMKAMIDALNVAYEVKDARSFIRLNLISFGFTLVAIVADSGSPRWWLRPSCSRRSVFKTLLARSSLSCGGRRCWRLSSLG